MVVCVIMHIIMIMIMITITRTHILMMRLIIVINMRMLIIIIVSICTRTYVYIHMSSFFHGLVSTLVCDLFTRLIGGALGASPADGPPPVARPASACPSRSRQMRHFHETCNLCACRGAPSQAQLRETLRVVPFRAPQAQSLQRKWHIWRCLSSHPEIQDRRGLTQGESRL